MVFFCGGRLCHELINVTYLMPILIIYYDRVYFNVKVFFNLAIQNRFDTCKAKVNGKIARVVSFSI